MDWAPCSHSSLPTHRSPCSQRPVTPVNAPTVRTWMFRTHIFKRKNKKSQVQELVKVAYAHNLQASKSATNWGHWVFFWNFWLTKLKHANNKMRLRGLCAPVGKVHWTWVWGPDCSVPSRKSLWSSASSYASWEQHLSYIFAVTITWKLFNYMNCLVLGHFVVPIR